MIISASELLSSDYFKPADYIAGGNPLLVVCDGVFDLLHPGHVDHLKQAKAQGSILLVLVAKDCHVKKGPNRPVFNEEERALMVNALACVDVVTLVDGIDIHTIINGLKPEIYCKGEDYKNSTDPELVYVRQLVESYGGKIVFTDGKSHSSSKIISNLRNPLPNGYLSRVKSIFSAADVLEYIDTARAMSVRVIGEPILDEYIYVKPAGKSAKENTIAYTGDVVQVFDGGATIIAGHLFQLAGRVLLVQENSAINKIRYVEQAFTQKVFSYIPYPKVMKSLNPEKLAGDFYNTDMTLVADFGHGLIPNTYVAKEVCRRSRWVALTVQSNSLNWGFNLLTKYPFAHYVVVDEMELRLACTAPDAPIKDLVERELTRLGAQLFVVTLGHEGCLLYDGEQFEHVPPLARNVVDRMGAGDALLAWSAPLAYLKAPIEMTGFVGSVAAALEVEAVGNVVITRQAMIDRIRELLG